LQVNIKNLIDDVQCYQTVRELRWPDGVECPSCQSTQVIKRGFDDTEPARQRYECTDCHKRFDDLTDTIFAGHHQGLKVSDATGFCGHKRKPPIEEAIKKLCSQLA
jgi:transposase-like protein